MLCSVKLGNRIWSQNLLLGGLCYPMNVIGQSLTVVFNMQRGLWAKQRVPQAWKVDLSGIHRVGVLKL